MIPTLIPIQKAVVHNLTCGVERRHAGSGLARQVFVLPRQGDFLEVFDGDIFSLHSLFRVHCQLPLRALLCLFSLLCL